MLYAQLNLSSCQLTLQVDVKKLVEGLKAARAEGGSSALQAAGPSVQENEMITAMRKGQGNALVQRIIGTGTLEVSCGQQ